MRSRECDVVAGSKCERGRQAQEGKGHAPGGARVKQLHVSHAGLTVQKGTAGEEGEHVRMRGSACTCCAYSRVVKSSILCATHGSSDSSEWLIRG